MVLTKVIPAAPPIDRARVGGFELLRVLSFTCPRHARGLRHTERVHNLFDGYQLEAIFND
jgi:hypothetical protein